MGRQATQADQDDEMKYNLSAVKSSGERARGIAKDDAMSLESQIKQVQKLTTNQPRFGYYHPGLF